MGGDDNVKVAVRVRPFNSREVERTAKLIVRMDGASTWVTNPKDAPNTSKQTVFNDLGVLFVENALAGYNCSIFAYGQTGSGKSYSMVGYGKDKGIIPLGVEELFERTTSNTDENVTYMVEVSFLEIYQENIRDLFAKDAGKSIGQRKGGLKVRQDKKGGVFVEALSKHPVATYEDVEHLMELGTQARTIAATNMNQTSSRAHSVFTVYFTQTKINRDTLSASDRTAKINLVDLAGSERQKSTGATGDRLKEGAAINMSLSALGNVISALAEAKKGVIIPYRDSVLTRLLQESLGGNSRTIMIAAISPASINFDETVSTLRYADRAKQIKNKAVINESPNEKLIRELREEVDRLKAIILAQNPELLGSDVQLPVAAGAAMTPEQEEEARKQREMNERLQKELADTKNFMDEQKQRWQQELEAARLEQEAREESLRNSGGGMMQRDENTPYFVNLSEDSQMAETLYYPFKTPLTQFGTKTPDEKDENTMYIGLKGLNVGPVHCVVKNEEGVCTIDPIAGHTFVNGTRLIIGEPCQLSDNDRLVLGNNHFFRYNDPIAAKEKNELREAHLKEFPDDAELPEWKAETFDWAYAQQELFAAQMSSLNIGAQKLSEDDPTLMKLKAELKKVQDDFGRDKADGQRYLHKLTRDLERARADGYQEEIDELTETLNQEKGGFDEMIMEGDAMVREKELEIEDYLRRKEKELNDAAELERTLVECIPMVHEVNEISQLMAKKMSFELKLITNISPVTREKETQVAILADGPVEGYQTYWAHDKFLNRIFIIRDMYQEWAEDPDAFFVEKEDDPFWDPPEDQLIGQAQIFLEGLAYGVEIELNTPIVDYSGHQQGELMVEVRPCDESGDIDNVDDEEWGEPDTRMDFLVRIVGARGLPMKYSYGTFCQYRFFAMEEPFLTERYDKRSINPMWEYERQFTVVPVTDEFMDHLKRDAMIIEIFGHSKEAEQIDAEEAEVAARAATPAGIDRLNRLQPQSQVGRKRSGSISMAIRATGAPEVKPQSPKSDPAKDAQMAEMLAAMELDAEEEMMMDPAQAAAAAAAAFAENGNEGGGEGGSEGEGEGEEEIMAAKAKAEAQKEAADREMDRLAEEAEALHQLDIRKKEEEERIASLAAEEERMKKQIEEDRQKAAEEIKQAKAEAEAQMKAELEERAAKDAEERKKLEKEMADMKAQLESSKLNSKSGSEEDEDEANAKKKEREAAAEELKKREEELKRKEQEFLEMQRKEMDKMKKEMEGMTPRGQAVAVAEKKKEKEKGAKSCTLL